jgi:hypothetical protein
MPNPESIVKKIEEAVHSARGQRVTGVQLSALIRLEDPEFSAQSFGCKNLREFVRKFAPKIAEVGRAGEDIVYGRPSEELPNLTGQSSKKTAPRAEETQGPTTDGTRGPRNIDQRVWKTFASPNTEFKLFANPETGETLTIPPLAAEPDLPWKRIPVCPAETHRRIAEDFISSLPSGPFRTEFSEALLSPSEWWIKFFEVAERTGLKREWSAYRRKRILEELDSAFRRLGIPAQTRVQAHLHPGGTTNRLVAAAPSPTGDSFLRAIVLRLAQTLSTGELRELKVSLGAIVDVLGERTRI